MYASQFSSKLLENAVNELSRLPGIGKKSALRLALYLLKQEKDSVERFAETVKILRNEICYCKGCYNISDTDVCAICANEKRDHRLVCVVDRKSTRLNSSH